MSRLNRDINFAHRRRWPDRIPNFISRLWLLASAPNLRLMLIHRVAYWMHSKLKNGGGRSYFLRMLLVPLAMLRLVIKINTKSDIANDCDIDGGVFFSEQGHIIFGAIKTGTGTVIGTRVTIGKSHVDGGRPEIGCNVWIGSDCVVYGGINIGDGATLLPGTVLSKNIPSGVVVQGNPARLVLRNFDNSDLRFGYDLDVMCYKRVINKSGV